MHGMRDGGRSSSTISLLIPNALQLQMILAELKRLLMLQLENRKLMRLSMA